MSDQPRIDNIQSDGGVITVTYTAAPAIDPSSRISALEAENARMRKALEFYADTSKYPAPLTGGMGALWSDCGEVAKAALR